MPDYEGYCLSSVPSTIMSVLGVKHQRPVLPKDALGNVETSGVDNVILLLCDGFGFNMWAGQTGKGFVKSISTKGNVRPITTVFPSTTAAALTTVSTGLTPQEHGLPEWYVYMDEIGDIMVTLPFTRVGDRGRDTLIGEFDPKAMFSGRTIFQQLKKEGVLRLSGLGSFRKRKSKARMGRNPDTGEQIKIPARTRLRFTPAKGLKDAVLGAR